LKPSNRIVTISSLLSALLSCSTGPSFDAVLPLIDRGQRWSIDASGYLVYRESLIGSRLSIFISPQLKSNYPLRIQLTLLSSFKDNLRLDPQKTVLTISGHGYSASAATCSSPSSDLGSGMISLGGLTDRSGASCIYLVFNTSQPDDWSKVSLNINGLLKGQESVSFPEVKFYKTKQRAPGSFM